jgi:hypothetical protein
MSDPMHPGMSVPGNFQESTSDARNHELDCASSTQLADWVILSGISSGAVRLFWILSMHLRDNPAAELSKAALAAMCGLKRASSINRPMQELIEIGALEVIRKRRADGGDAPSEYRINARPSVIEGGQA